MKIVRDAIGIEEIKSMAEAMFGDMVKAVVDLDRELLAVDAELHSDIEAELLRDGSRQAGLWGINLYPGKKGADFVEYDSLINIRPSAGNRGRSVENSDTRKRILELVEKRVRK